jgi:hypothetical protein
VCLPNKWRSAAIPSLPKLSCSCGVLSSAKSVVLFIIQLLESNIVRKSQSQKRPKRQSKERLLVGWQWLQKHEGHVFAGRQCAHTFYNIVWMRTEPNVDVLHPVTRKPDRFTTGDFIAAFPCVRAAR